MLFITQKVFIDMKSEHYTKLQNLIESTFEAHQFADWSNKTARATIAKSIIKRFKEYMSVYS
tara:strand:- start:1009 stop:1194 length:186 start_codon:yes stop_codon:yes gene_type:complete